MKIIWLRWRIVLYILYKQRYFYPIVEVERMEATDIQKERYAAVTLKAKAFFLGTEMHPNN